MKSIKPSTVTVLCLTCFAFIWLAGCTTYPVTQPTALPVATTPPPQSTVTPQPTATNPQSTPSLSPTTSSTPDLYPTYYYPTDFAVSDWMRFYYSEAGISIEYPINWQVETREILYNSKTSYEIIFTSPEEAFVECRISDISSEGFDWFVQPPSSIYYNKEVTVVWEQMIETNDMTGWEVIVFPMAREYEDYSIRLLNEAKGKGIVLYVKFDTESLYQAQESGFEEVIAERYSFFEHMAKSVEFLD